MSKKKKPHWNYRVLTRMVKLVTPFWREYFLAEVYYDEDSVPTSYAEECITNGYDEVKSMEWTVKHLKKAFKKPILDVDNWPSEYIAKN